MKGAAGRRRGLVHLVIALVSAPVLVLSAGASGALARPAATTAAADAATINVVYSATALQVKLSTGATVTSGSTIPAGTYTVLVYDSGDVPTPSFQMSGPGVNVSSNLNSTGMGLDVPSTFGPFTLQTSSSYTVQDGTLGASSRISFSTSATASSSGGSSSGGTSSGGTSSGGTSGSTSGGSSSGTGSSSTSGGTAAAAMRGTLKGAVTVSGKLSLTVGGKKIAKLAGGRWSITFADHSKAAGLVLGHGTAPAKTLSSAAAVGTSTHSVVLTAGRWYFAPSARGARTFFTVT